MSHLERILQAALFELGALSISAIALYLFGDSSQSHALFLAIAISFIAMLWSFVFNWLFDKCFTGRREERGWWLRLGHSLSFETGLLLFTVPLIMYQLELGLWQALMADIGITLLILGYSLLFHWLYDHLRLRFVG